MEKSKQTKQTKKAVKLVQTDLKFRLSVGNRVYDFVSNEGIEVAPEHLEAVESEIKRRENLGKR